MEYGRNLYYTATITNHNEEESVIQGRKGGSATFLISLLPKHILKYFFYLEIYKNNIFLFFKLIFNINLLKQSKRKKNRTQSRGALPRNDYGDKKMKFVKIFF
jgi:hypothetical protein